MLTHDLGYRPPKTIRQFAAPVLDRIGLLARGVPEQPTSSFRLPFALLCAKPLICYSGIVPDAPLGFASVLPKSFTHKDAWFLLGPTWSIESESDASRLRQFAILHRRARPRHKLAFLCNTSREVDLMRGQGEAAFFLNMTSIVQDSVFRPLDGVPIEYDAIYNAQLVPWKRHELTLDIERCGFIFYRAFYGAAPVEFEEGLIRHHAERAPGHVFINRIDSEGTPERLDQETVNRHLNRAAVGLCLSHKEGAMFASTEYLLAGLPVVSTPSIGGRDVYYDDDISLIVEPDPRSVAEGVAALKARNLPRAMIRERTLERVDRDRARFVDLVNAITREGGGSESISVDQLLARPLFGTWPHWADAVERAVAGMVDIPRDVHAAS